VALTAVQDERAGSVYRGPSTPVTCVAVGGPRSSIVFAGCWDKSIWSWNIESQVAGQRYHGHTDFVKAVVCARIGGKDLLVSGGADKKILVWDVESGERLHTLQDSAVNMLAIQDLVIDPAQSTPDEIYLVSASSDPHIRWWRISLAAWEQVAVADPAASGTERRVILEHETSVYKVVFDQESDEVDLWTASGDGTAKSLSRLQHFASEDTFNHGDHVRAVALTDQWVVTAGRDEDLKLWDRASGKLAFVLIGHYDEITDLVVLQGRRPRDTRICSVSIDGTVRTWPVTEEELKTLVAEQEELADKQVQEEVKHEAPDGLTAEEEAELADLMDDD
jgi:WD40 repeat protein